VTSFSVCIDLSQPGDVLSGSVSYVKSKSGQPGASKRPDNGYTIVYTAGPSANSTSSDTSKPIMPPDTQTEVWTLSYQ
jgi:hypothetical protein